MVYMINLCKIIFSLFPSPWLSKNKNSPVYDYPYPGSGLIFLQPSILYPPYSFHSASNCMDLSPSRDTKDDA